MRYASLAYSKCYAPPALSDISCVTHLSHSPSDAPSVTHLSLCPSDAPPVSRISRTVQVMPPLSRISRTLQVMPPLSRTSRTLQVMPPPCHAILPSTQTTHININTPNCYLPLTAQYPQCLLPQTELETSIETLSGFTYSVCGPR